MNISAVMWSLDVWGIDHMAKCALTALACRANRDGVAKVSTPRLAADLAVSYNTARRATARLLAAGYVDVIHRSGVVSEWTLHPAHSCEQGGVPTSAHGGAQVMGIHPAHLVGRSFKESLEKIKEKGGEVGVAVARHPSNGGAVDNSGVHFLPGSGRIPNWSTGEK